MSDDERTQAERILDVLAICMLNIARGTWNAGRPSGKWMTALEYAEHTLRGLGLWDDSNG